MKNLLFVPLLFAPALALADDAPAKTTDITLTFTAQEVQAIANILDTAVKSCGLSCAPNIVYFQNKFAAPPTPPAPPGK